MTNITAMQADMHEAPGRLSNRLMHLAHEASAALTRHKRASVEAAQAHLDAGDILIEAKAHCQHGEWQTFLKTANIAERTARRAMRLARSVLDADAIAETGGVKAALESLAKSKTDTVTVLPTPPEPPLATPRERRRELRVKRRDAGRCIDCGAPSDGFARCPRHRAEVSAASARRRGLARVGEAIVPRLQQAAAEGSGVRLSPDDVAAILEQRGDGIGDA